MGEAPRLQVVLWEENRLDSCLGFEHREAVFAFADGPSDCEGCEWGHFGWRPSWKGKSAVSVFDYALVFVYCWGGWLPQQPYVSYTGDLKCLDKLQMWIFHTKTGGRISIYVCKHFSMFSLHVRPTSVLLHFHPWQHLKTVVFLPKVENERNLYRPIFDTCPTASGPLKGFDSPWSDVSMRALIQVNDIFSVCCELVNRKNSTFIKLWTCAVNILCHL